MVYDVIELKRDIRIILDQNSTSAQLEALSDIDTLSVNEIIESKIVDAAHFVEKNAPLYMLDSGMAFGDSIGWETRVGNGVGYVSLPSDFMRFISFQMSDWSRSVTTYITEDSPLYSLQRSRYGGIRGCPQKPVVAITQQPIGLVLEFFSCTAGENVYIKRARYIPIPKIEKGKIELCENLKSAIEYYAAYLTALTLGAQELATVLLNTSNDLSK